MISGAQDAARPLQGGVRLLHEHDHEARHDSVYRVVRQVDPLAVHDAVLDVAGADLRPAAAELDHLGVRSVEISRPPSPTAAATASPVSPEAAPSSSTVCPGLGATAATSQSRTGASSPSIRRGAGPSRGPWPPTSRRAWGADQIPYGNTITAGLRCQHAPDRGPEGTLGRH